ncbi:MAG TPA: glycosyltransferase family 4 protein [Terracidiphilus sp.]|nr:glycosyltransferase family 4 protein [Terracidiphilus sp.]
MNVCMLTYSFFESDTRILQYTAALTARGDTVDVLSLQREGSPVDEVLDGVRIHRLQKRTVNEKGPFAYLKRILSFMAKAALYLSRPSSIRRYDVIHVHSVPDFLVFATLAPRLLGAKVILDIHDILPEFYAAKFGLSKKSLMFRALALCEKFSAGFANHVIIANDLWRARLLERTTAPDKCLTVRNYPDPDFFHPYPHVSDGKTFRIVYPGTLNEHQGLDIALRAFARVTSAIPEARFDIYGEGPALSQLKTLRETLQLENRVYFHGFLPVKEIGRHMAEADLAVVPKRVSTGFGNEAASTKIMEFMSVGVPVIVSRTQIDSLEYDDSAVHFVQPEDEVALGEAILYLHDHPEYREQLVDGAFAYLQQHNWAKRKFDYLAVVDSLCPRTKRKSEREVHA